MSCLSGSGRAYGLDLELVKSPSTSTRTSQTSSSSSTITESSNFPLAITTRKPRTPRKRPNQNYNEAAALLSTVYPNIFSFKHLTKPHKFTKPYEPFSKESSELLPFRVFDNCGFLLPHPVPEKPYSRIESKLASFSCKSSGEVDSRATSIGLGEEYCEDLDTESILDEEIEEGIDSIMGNLSTSSSSSSNNNGRNPITIGLGFGWNFRFGLGVREGIRAFRHVDNGNWWSFPTVDVHQISPRFNSINEHNKNLHSNSQSGEKKKKKKKLESKSSEVAKGKKSSNSGLLLKLNYDEVLNAWSDRGSPFSDEIPSTDGNDVSARLTQLDLFSKSGVGGASVLRCLRASSLRRSNTKSKKSTLIDGPG